MASEALASGVPVVAGPMSVAAGPHYVGGDVGFFAPSDDAAGYAQAMVGALNAPSDIHGRCTARAEAFSIAALADALKSGWSLDMPASTQTTMGGETRAIRSGQDQMLLAFPHPTPDANAVVQTKLNGASCTTDQTDSWVTLEISGPDTMAAMERLCPLDLASFETGTSGRTVMEHIGAFVVKTGDNRFLLMSASSSAQSFLDAVETSYRYVT